MASFIVAARRCDASVIRGAPEHVNNKLPPGRLGALLSGELRREAPQPSVGKRLAVSAAARRTVLHGGFTAGGGVLNEGMLPYQEPLSDTADPRSRHGVHHTISTDLAGDKMRATDPSMSRLERLLTIQRRRESAQRREIVARPLSPPEECVRNSTIDNPKFGSTGSEKAQAALSHLRGRVETGRAGLARTRAELLKADAEEQAKQDRREARRRESYQRKVTALEREMKAAAAARAAIEEEQRRIEFENNKCHPIDVLRFAIRRDLIEERADLVALADEEWGYTFHERLDRMLDAENDVSIEHETCMRQEEALTDYPAQPSGSNRE